MSYEGSTVKPVAGAAFFPRHGALGAGIVVRKNKKRQIAMFKHTKVRQAGLILFATTLLLILPNLTKVIG
jgi:hypothetical protein